MKKDELLQNFEYSINEIYNSWKEYKDMREWDFIKDYLNIHFPKFIFSYDINFDYFFITNII